MITVPPQSSAQIDAWVFDLDNTLYAPDSGLLMQVNILMTQFIEQRLGLSNEDASALRNLYWRQHGATMTGLVREHRIDAHEFLDATHRLDLSGLVPDPALNKAIAKLPGRRLVHTNGPRVHATRVLAALGLSDVFEQVITIEDTGLVPKPREAAHQTAVLLGDLAPRTTAMIEDTPANLVVPRKLGMQTIWLRHDPGQQSPEHVDHVIADLTTFLRPLSSG